MIPTRAGSTLLTTAVALGSFALAGCENLLPSEGSGHGSATTRPSPLAGGALGPTGGYLTGISFDKNDAEHHDEAIRASSRAETNPAKPDDVRNSRSADLNEDGFVTLDEVIAMHDAGLSDTEQVARLQATGQVFALTPQQEQFLRDRGVDRAVVDAIRAMNHAPPAAQTAADTTTPPAPPR